MVKILLGLVAAVVIAAGGFFGFELYAQHRIASEIDASFAQIRAGGGKASHGPISIDLLKRTVTITEIATETAAQPPVSLKIADVVASGVRHVDATHVSADRIEISDLEIAGTPFGGRRISYKAPQMTAKDFAGPIQALLLPPTSSSAIDIYRLLTAQFIDMSASSISAPSIASTMILDAPVHAAADFLYSGVTFEGIRNGRIATSKVDDLKLTIDQKQAGRSDKLNGHLAGLTALDFDMKATAALLDPKRADDNSLHQMYRQLAIGTYEFTAGPGLSMRVDGITVDDVGVRPSRVLLENYLAALPQTDAEPTAAQAREMMEKTAGLYEGAHVGNAEVRGISIETPEGRFKLAAIRLKLNDGKGDIALEGLDARTPTGPFRMGRLALKSFDIAGLMRLPAQLPPGQPPSPAQGLALLHLIEGVEVKGVVAPFKTTNKQFTIDTVSLNWGQFVGAIPTQAHLVAKMAAPVDATDPELQPLLAAGLNRLAIDLDLGAAWTETSESFALSPATVDIGNLLKASAGISLAHVPRGVFSLNPTQAMGVAPEIEAGTLELNLHDAGALDLLVAQYAGAHNQSRDAARAAIIDNIKANGEQIASANPDGAAAVEAVTRFVETPGQTLVIKLTPRAKAPVLQLLQLLKTDPATAIAQFKIEASTGL
jgi:hypothetical protein